MEEKEKSKLRGLAEPCQDCTAHATSIQKIVSSTYTVNIKLEICSY